MTEQPGRVIAYDARRGLGTVEGDDGRRFGFHCTAVADGSRDIPSGFRSRSGSGPGTAPYGRP